MPASVVPVLMYHHVSPTPGLITVSPAHFAAQMRWLKRQGYTTLKLDALAGFGLPVRGGTRLRADARVRSGRATAANSTNPRMPLAKLGQPCLY